MDIEKIHTAATNFRNAIEEISHSLGATFESFPRGSCGDATPMLGTYLIDQGLGEFQYMQGDYGSEAEGNWSSHAWLQSGNLVIDITADQFPDVTDPVVVMENSKWHHGLAGEEQNIGDYRVYDPSTVANLGRLYAKIVAAINAT